ncbi:MAG: glycosyltransferase family 9 protein [Planctomycetota bacterium]|jgi:hypothetical protein
MKPSVYRKEWIELRQAAAPSADDLSHLSRRIAFSFLDHYIQRDFYEPDYIDLLCEMATSFTESDLNNIASSALFEIIVERLCDDFEDFRLEAYARVMSQVISYCRKLPAGEKLNRCLDDYGVTSFEKLFDRALKLHTQQFSYNTDKPVERAVLLSRVTIGADVAITSVIVQRLLELWPGAEIVIIASAKLKGIFGGNPQIRLRELNYSRRGGLLERFESWYAVLDILAQEVPPDRKDNTLIIDPDSRISQLAVLPVSLDDNYLFFNSRAGSLASSHLSMAEMANRWMDSVFGRSGFGYPNVWLGDPQRLRAHKMAAALRKTGCKHIFAVNFGIGGNPRKRVDSEFESKLLLRLLNVPGTVIILDKGFGAEELSRSAALIEHIRSRGYQIMEAGFEDIESTEMTRGVIAVECGIGEMAALISISNAFIGYDSACQHIAAALKVPTTTVFAGTNNMGFIRRWSACGDTRCSIVHVKTLEKPSQVDIDDVVLRIMGEVVGTERAAVRERIVETRRRPARDAALRRDVLDEVP